jgi:hypothetical protein
VDDTEYGRKDWFYRSYTSSSWRELIARKDSGGPPRAVHTTPRDQPMNAKTISYNSAPLNRLPTSSYDMQTPCPLPNLAYQHYRHSFTSLLHCYNMCPAITKILFIFYAVDLVHLVNFTKASILAKWAVLVFVWIGQILILSYRSSVMQIMYSLDSVGCPLATIVIEQDTLYHSGDRIRCI